MISFLDEITAVEMSRSGRGGDTSTNIEGIHASVIVSQDGEIS